jgi:hypothetical protein
MMPSPLFLQAQGLLGSRTACVIWTYLPPAQNYIRPRLGAIHLRENLDFENLVLKTWVSSFSWSRISTRVYRKFICL